MAESMHGWKKNLYLSRNEQAIPQCFKIKNRNANAIKISAYLPDMRH